MIFGKAFLFICAHKDRYTRIIGGYCERGSAMAIEKLSDSVSIDRAKKVIYFSALDDESKFLIEMNREEGYVIKSASEMPKPKKRRRKSDSKQPKKKDFEPTLTADEKKIYDAALKDNADKKPLVAYNAAYAAVMNARKNK